MVYSMTGFAAKTLVIFPETDNPVNISLSLKALNSRFFETTCKLPYALNNFETDFIKLFKTKLVRGHIYFTIHASSQHLLSCTVKPNLDIIKGYLAAVEQIKKEAQLQGNLALDKLLELPNVFNVEEKDIDAKSRMLLYDTVEQLIEEVIEARKKEGVSLKKDLEQRITIIQHEIDSIEHAYNTLMEQQKALVSEELETLHEDVAEPRRQVLYSMLDKIDIHEEIVRFKSHLANFSTQLVSTTIEKGKKIDFTLQELAREINTIAAKCSDSTISGLAINIKVELEKAREQVQNIV
jgi:TIGR00255 family protein